MEDLSATANATVSLVCLIPRELFRHLASTCQPTMGMRHLRQATFELSKSSLVEEAAPSDAT